MIPDGKDFKAVFCEGLKKELGICVPAAPDPDSVQPITTGADGDIMTRTDGGPVGGELPDPASDPGVKNRPLSGTDKELLKNWDGRKTLSRKQIVYATMKRGVKSFATAAVPVFLATKDPLSAVVAGIGLGIIGGGSKGLSEKFKSEGKPGLAAAVNPIDTCLKIVLELVRAYRISLELKLERGN